MRSNPGYCPTPNSPIAGTILDAAYIIGRSRNYLYELQKRGLLKIYTDARRPKVRTVIYSELLEAVRKAAESDIDTALRPGRSLATKGRSPPKRCSHRRQARKGATRE